MKTNEITEMLENILKLIETEQNEQATEFIHKKILEIKDKEDVAGDYIDDLVGNLK